MSTDQDQIKGLITRWAAAIQARDLDGVVAGHTEDQVMFDVPPPTRGVRGIEEYRRSWPPFFEFIASGAVFDIEELDVVADDTVAFAYGLARCGGEAEFAADPENRLRLSFGLRKTGGEWRIAHEHHSFPMKD